MRSVGINLGHDGAVALVEDASLVFSIEAEKDGHERFSAFSPDRLRRLVLPTLTAGTIVSYSGWNFTEGPLAGTYFGLQSKTVAGTGLLIQGRLSPHERAHIISSFALSPYPQGEPCYALVWEGSLGSLYLLDATLSITKIADILISPGKRYSLVYELAHPNYPDSSRGHSADVAGKLMALAAYGSGATATKEEQRLLDYFLLPDRAHEKGDLRHTHLYNVGVQDENVARFAWLLSEGLFGLFFDRVKACVTGRRNLIISGGCGLNCEWNSRWKDSGLFNDIFVPPVTNDSGVAIGAAADAQLSATGSAKLSWSVYSGEDLVEDVGEVPGLVKRPFSTEEAASLLADGAILAWAQGRYEIGPRALGNRSLLASPFSQGARTRLNEIKERELYRPIAPVCTEDEADLWFAGRLPSPHMLYFSTVRNDRLEAVRHIDNTARVQTVSKGQNESLYALLGSFAARKDGVSVLCNTSLNRKSKGFMNKVSDITRFAIEKGIDAVATQSSLYINVEWMKLRRANSTDRGRNCLLSDALGSRTQQNESDQDKC